MNLTIFFRILLGTSIVLGLTGILSEFITVFLLPAPLQQYWKAEFNADPGIMDLLGMLVALPTLGLMIAAYIGLFLLKRWGRTCYLVAMVLAYLCTPLFGPYVLSGITYLLYDLATLAGGMILAMAYFSPIKDELSKPAAPQAPAIP